MSRPLISRAAATCIAVGNASFEDWPRLTWSFGWTSDFSPSLPPSAWLARFAITSLAFMLDCVPDPVCQTTSGNSPSCRPATTSAAAPATASARRGSSTQVLVHGGRRLLHEPERVHQRRRHALDADAEVLQRALRLGAPVAFCRNLDRTESIA